MTRSVLWKTWLAPALLLAVVWLALTGLFAGQFVVVAAQPWDESLSKAAGFWMPWLPFLPVTWVFSRWLLRRNTGPVLSVVLHVVMCGLVVFGCQAMTPERPAPNGWQQREREREREREAEREREGGNAPRAEEANGRPPRSEGGPPPWQRDRERERGQRPGGPPQGRMRSFFGPLGFRSLIDAVVYGGVVSLTYSLAFLRRSRERERRTLELEASLSRARLDALRLQINPHFLFNTLNAIASLIHARPDDADEMIGSLSELLRASLHSDGTHEHTLARELEVLRLFTGIERTRFGERVQFVDDVAADTLTGRVPALVLQPLVENAIRHGLEPQTGAGTVTVRARRDGENLVLCVSDDGAGYDAEKAAHPDSGIGMANTRHRLEALYGTDQRMTIERGAERGTVVTITLPWHAV